MTKSQLTEEDITDIILSRGLIPAYEIRKKHHIGVPRQKSIWASFYNMNNFLRGMESWQKPPKWEPRNPVGRPRGSTKNKIKTPVEAPPQIQYL